MPSERQKLITKASVDFQRMVRARDGAFAGKVWVHIDGEVKHVFAPLGIVICITCGKVLPWAAPAGLGIEGAQGGHYLSRKHLSTRFVEINCHSQCPKCNDPSSGDVGPAYRMAMVKRYGEQAVDELHRQAHTEFDWTIDQLKTFRKETRQRLANYERVINGEQVMAEKSDKKAHEYKPHPAAEIFPMMTTAELQKLAEDIKQNGQQEIIELYEGMVIDGRNRLAACIMAEVEAKLGDLEEYEDFDDLKKDGQFNPRAYVMSKNRYRRQLSTSQSAICAAKITLPFKRGDKSGMTLEAAAESFGVSPRTVQMAVSVFKKGCPELKGMLEQDRIKPHVAAEVLSLPKKEQQALCLRGAKAVKEWAKPKEPELDKGLPVDTDVWATFQGLMKVAPPKVKNDMAICLLPTVDVKEVFGSLSEADRGRISAEVLELIGGVIAPEPKAKKNSKPPLNAKEIVEWWNDLATDLGNSKTKPDTKSVKDAVKLASADKTLRSYFEDLPTLEVKIRKADFCHGQSWFTLPKLLRGKNKDGELIVEKILDEGYTTNGKRKSDEQGRYFEPAEASL